MKKELFVAASLLLATAIFAAMPEGDLNYYGYSNEVVKNVKSDVEVTNYANSNSNNEAINEVDSTVEQLNELGVSRSLVSSDPSGINPLRIKSDQAWAEVYERIDEANKPVRVDDATKAQLKANLTQVLTENGYTIQALDLLDLDERIRKYAVRAVIKVTKPMKTGSYEEVNDRLNYLEQICTSAATIDGYCYLAEMSTFIAENPKNQYHYAKSIIKQ